MKISHIQRRCLIEATIDPLRVFRRGFARTKAGPFFHQRTVQALVTIGALRAFHPRRGKRGLQVSARTA